MRLVAIDFETANEQRASACAIGLAWMEHGEIVEVEEHFIRPPEMRFKSINIAIHGIRPEQVEDAPEFPDILDLLAPRLDGAVVIAHNAAFDISVMRAGCDAYGLAYPDFDYLGTMKAARAAWPELGTAKLNHLCDHFGIALDHHRAGSDAVGCAMISSQVARSAACADFPGAAAQLGLSTGRLGGSAHAPCSSRPAATRSSAKPRWRR